MAEPMAGQEERPGHDLDALIVDDEPRLADLFAAWLDSRCTVTTAYDGEQALDLMNDSIDLVLLDRRMPGLSGDEVLSTIQSNGYDCYTVMITAIDLDLEIMGAGYDEYLVKPISKRQLTELVDDILRQAPGCSTLREKSESMMESTSSVSGGDT